MMLKLINIGRTISATVSRPLLADGRKVKSIILSSLQFHVEFCMSSDICDSLVSRAYMYNCYCFKIDFGTVKGISLCVCLSIFCSFWNLCFHSVYSPS